MYIKKLLKIINGQLVNNVGDLDCEIAGFKTDSRDIEKNDVFVAINSGINFIDEVVVKGAIAIITEKDIKATIMTIKVDKVFDALEKLGIYYRRKYANIPLIAVTGSLGKTTTKELIYSILSKKYKVLKNQGNKNNHIGLPITLTNLNSNYDVIVLEMGMNHFGEIEKLSKIAKPNYGVITNIGTSHIGNLKSRRNIFKAKMEIVKGMKLGTLIVNGNDKYLSKLQNTIDYDVIKCGFKNSILDIVNIKEYVDKITFTIKIDNKNHPFMLKIPNLKILENVLLAIEIGLLFDIDIDLIKEAIQSYKMAQGRMHVIKKDDLIIIDDCYNASIESTIQSIDYLNKYNGKKILILGDLKELGKYTKKIHRKIGKYLKKYDDIDVYLVGENTLYTKEVLAGAKHYLNKDDLMNDIQDIINATILIKGSRAMELEEVKNFIMR